MIIHLRKLTLRWYYKQGSRHSISSFKGLNIVIGVNRIDLAKIDSFQFIYVSKVNNPIILSNKGGVFNDSVLRVLQAIAPGDKIIIRKIQGSYMGDNFGLPPVDLEVK